MNRKSWMVILASVAVRAQNVENPAELLRKVMAAAENTRNWQAEFVETSQLSGPGLSIQNEVRSKLAAQTPLKMSRQNSGGDRTVLVCDGVGTFYSGDGKTYYKGNAAVTPQCDFPLSKFYELEMNPASVSAVGKDHVRLADADRLCEVVRATWKKETISTVRTMCIDVARSLILQDHLERGDEKTGIHLVKTTTFTNFEIDPVFPPDAFRFSIPPGAVEVKRP